jgi:signal transduction histidine kinase
MQILQRLFRSGSHQVLRRAILIFGVVSCLIPGLIFLQQALSENADFYERYRDSAWQVTSLYLAQLNTGHFGSNSQNRYELVTRDFGNVSLRVDIGREAVVDEYLLASLDPQKRLERSSTQNGLTYTGTFAEGEQEYHQSIFLIYYSADIDAYHLASRGLLTGYIALQQPIAQAKQGLLLSHWTKLALWAGACVAIWFLLLAVGGGMIAELESLQAKLLEAERHSLISKVVCTYNHRINSPLMGIFGAIDLLSSQEDDPRKIKLIRNLGEAADQIKSATDELAASTRYDFVTYNDDVEMIGVVGRGSRDVSEVNHS